MSEENKNNENNVTWKGYVATEISIIILLCTGLGICLNQISNNHTERLEEHQKSIHVGAMSNETYQQLQAERLRFLESRFQAIDKKLDEIRQEVKSP